MAAQQAPPVATSSAQALRSASIYALATTLRGAFSFLLLPLYTHVLSPSEYGRLAIILTITTGASILFSFGLDLALFRGFFQLASEPLRQRRLIDSLWAFLVVAPLAAAVVLIAAVAPWLSSDSIVRPSEIAIGLVAAAMYVAATTAPLSLLRAQQRTRDYLTLSVIYTVATSAATLTLVVGFNAGIRGWLIALLLANTAAFVAAVRMIPWRRPKPFDCGLVRDGLILGLPLVPHFLGHWALFLADRAVLGTIVSTAAVGVYTLAATLALPAQMLVQALGQAFMPSYAAAATGEAERAALPAVATVQAATVLILCLAVALLGPSLVSLVAPASYGGAVPLIPWIALGYAFLGLYSIPMSAVSLRDGRTRFVWVATAAAAITNIALIYLLVPGYGIEAAAVASAIGYLVLLLAIAWHARSPLNPVNYEWARLLRVVGVIAGAYVGAVVTTDATGMLSAIERVAWLAVAGLGLAVCAGVSVRRLRTVVRRPRPV